jgi:protocatechuate 3,4-dioxygenase beta subunit
METEKKAHLSRKGFLQASLGIAGAMAAGQAFSNAICHAESTGAQPLGPFFPKAGSPVDPIREHPDPNVPIHLANDNDLTFVNGRTGHALGRVVFVTGKVTDADCQPIRNASLVVWQAASSGRYNHTGDDENVQFRHPETGEILRREMDPSFQYWGRTLTDSSGNYLFKTIIPGFYPADLAGGWYRPPHIHFLVSATGYQQLTTQLYFNVPDAADNHWIQTLNSRDNLLQSREITDAERGRLVVDFVPATDPSMGLALAGTFDLTLKR